MKNSAKRILCAILCTALMGAGTAFAKEENPPSDNDKVQESTVQDKQADSEEEKKQDTGLRYNPDSEYPVFSGYTPSYSQHFSINYASFMDILKLYVDTHLFEFTTEQATEAFLMKLIKENPELMPMFIQTLLTTMDPYSGYYQAGQGLASDGSAPGYGISVTDEQNGNIIAMGRKAMGLYIMTVVKDSPAEYAGLMSGDRLVSIEGISLEGATIDGFMLLLSGLPIVPEEQFDEAGNSLGIPNEPEFILDEASGKKTYYIHLEVERNGELIPIKMAKGRYTASDVVYTASPDKSHSTITISSFTGDTVTEDFANAIELAKKQGSGNLLIDLAGNTGGVVDYAIEMANMLIPEKDRIICYYNSREHAEPEPVLSKGGGYAFDRITVIVDNYSASAAELFAMTLSYNCGATIVGTTTYGKAVGQQGYTFPSGDMFTITCMEILDPLKRSYHNMGLTPDIEIDYVWKKFDFPTDIPEFVFTPNTVTKDYNPDSETGERPAVSFADSESSESIAALEKRLEILGFLRPEKSDGIYDKATHSAICAFEIYLYGEPEGLLDEDEAKLLVSLSDKNKNYFYKQDVKTEVAQMTFRSVSQAKRLVKELTTESKRVKKEYDEFLKAEKERIAAEEKAEIERLEAEARAAEEAAEKAAEEATQEATEEAEENPADKATAEETAA